jgi:hypothetical protein
MRSPALAIAWEFWGRNRWGLSAVAAGLLVLTGLCQVLPARATANPLISVSGLLVFFASIYLLSVFIHADLEQGDRRSGFPSRWFTLPVRTSLLVAWPMLYGMAAVALLWVATAWLVWRPCGVPPRWWPATLAAASLACFQSFCWTLVTSPLVRLVAAVMMIPSLALSVVYVLMLNPAVAERIDELGLSVEEAVALFFTGLIPVAYAVAVAGVARARRGDGLGWARLRHWLVRAFRRPAARAADVPPRRLEPFASPARAQLWLEWRQKGILLPLFQGGLMLFLTACHVMTGFELADVLRGLVAVAGVPVLVGFFVGFGMGKASFWSKDLSLSPWHATRPLTSDAMALAKLRTAALSALAAWALTALVAPAWVALTGNAGRMADLWDALSRQTGALRVWAAVPLALAGLVVLTWLQLSAGLSLCLTGRPWVVNAAVSVYLALGGGLLWLGLWALSHPEFYDTFLTVMWWLAALLALLKSLAAGWVFRTGLRGGLLERRTLAGVLGGWLLGAASLAGVLYLVLPADRLPVHLLAVWVILACPLVRVAAVPLALAWNRHR